MLQGSKVGNDRVDLQLTLLHPATPLNPLFMRQCQVQTSRIPQPRMLWGELPKTVYLRGSFYIYV